nr:MAG TPA: hypothetical protein [Caudoviricetes sp.]
MSKRRIIKMARLNQERLNDENSFLAMSKD